MSEIKSGNREGAEAALLRRRQAVHRRDQHGGESVNQRNPLDQHANRVGNGTGSIIGEEDAVVVYRSDEDTGSHGGVEEQDSTSEWKGNINRASVDRNEDIQSHDASVKYISTNDGGTEHGSGRDVIRASYGGVQFHGLDSEDTGSPVTNNISFLTVGVMCHCFFFL